MQDFNRKKHWDHIYQSKNPEEVSWFQTIPETSLEYIKKANLPKDANIIDIGGGDSSLVDYLLDLGYQNISVLDISQAAIDKAKERLGEKTESVNWIVADASEFKPNEQYDFWHDRAAFHFLTEDQEIRQYVETAKNAIKPDGLMLIGTFSDEGPTKCSGIEIKQYTEDSMNQRFEPYFDKMECKRKNHKTPFETSQNFVFCLFKRKKSDEGSQNWPLRSVLKNFN